MEKKGDLSDFECGMVVGLSISKTADLLGFSCTTISGFTEHGPKNRKYPVSSSCVEENALLMSEVRREFADWLNQITFCCPITTAQVPW